MTYLIFIVVVHLLVGWAYYELAEKHGRNKWLYAIIGITSYYIAKSIMTAAELVLLYKEIIATGESAEFEAWILGLNFLVGIFTCFGLFQILDHRWSQNPRTNSSSSLPDILDDVI